MEAGLLVWTVQEREEVRPLSVRVIRMESLLPPEKLEPRVARPQLISLSHQKFLQKDP